MVGRSEEGMAVEGLTIRHEVDESQLDDLIGLYQISWWGKHRTRDDIRRMLAGSFLVVAINDEAGRLVGFCRLLSDGVYRGTVYDVIVHESWQGRGVGRLVMETLMNHPKVRVIESLALDCVPEKVALYEKWGFKVQGGHLLHMSRRPANIQPPG